MSQAQSGMSTELQMSDGLSPEGFDTISEVRNIGVPSIKLDFDEVTNLDSTSEYREYIPTLKDGGELDATANFLPDDETHQDFQAAIEARTLKNWRVEYPDGGYHYFQGYAAEYKPDVQFDKAMTVTLKIRVTGPVSYQPAV